MRVAGAKVKPAAGYNEAPETIPRGLLENSIWPGLFGVFGFAHKRVLAGAAAAVDLGTIDFVALRRAEPEAAIRALSALPGIGPWTAAYVALRGLGCRDAFPAGDLGVRKALAGRDGKLPSEREVLARAETWRPWRGYAVLHLWESLG